jgi:hypothetical protein
MKKLLWLVCLNFVLACSLNAQSFEIAGIQEYYKGLIGETIKAPIRFKNTSDKTITLIVRKIHSQIGGTQKNYYCIDNNCLDQRIDDYTLKIEPDQTLSALQIALDGGLAQTHSSIRYIAFNKANPAESIEFELNFLVEEKAEKENIYSSRQILLHDLYPNPVSVEAFVNYKVLDDQVKAKIVIHNILGNAIDEYPLPFVESRVKISAEPLSAGIYFYTLYIDTEAVCTRKLIVKK